MRIVNGKAYPTVTETDIHGFFEQYRCFSNFHPCPVEIDGLTYPSSEHAYMAMKTTDAFQRKKLAFEIVKPGDAKKFGGPGGGITLREGWDAGLRDTEMDRVVYAKFSQNKAEQSILLSTLGKSLHETNWWKDTYWGVCEGIGQDKLGKTLERVRDRIAREMIPGINVPDESVPANICTRMGEEEFCHTDYSFTSQVHDYNGPDGVLKAYAYGKPSGMPIGSPRSIDVFVDPSHENHKPEHHQAILLEVVIHPSITDNDLEQRLREFTSSLMQGK